MLVAPRWVETAAQPIAIEDVVDYLVAALDHRRRRVFEIGGEDQVTYGEILREYARQRGSAPAIAPMPVVTPRVSRFCLGLLTPVYGQVAGAMVDSLRNETVVRTDAAVRAFPVRPRGLRAAIARALVNEDQEFAETRWSDALPTQRPLGWSGIRFGRRQVSSRAIEPGVRPSTRLSRSGVSADRPAGMPRTGSGEPADCSTPSGAGSDSAAAGAILDLRVGDTVDFWRVERFEPTVSCASRPR